METFCNGPQTSAQDSFIRRNDQEQWTPLGQGIGSLLRNPGSPCVTDTSREFERQKQHACAHDECINCGFFLHSPDLAQLAHAGNSSRQCFITCHGSGGMAT